MTVVKRSITPIYYDGIILDEPTTRWVGRLRRGLERVRVSSSRISRLVERGFKMNFEVRDGRWRRLPPPVDGSIAGQRHPDPTMTRNIRDRFSSKLRGRVSKTIAALMKLLKRIRIGDLAGQEGPILDLAQLSFEISSAIQTSLLGGIEDLLEEETRVIVERAANEATRRFAKAAGVPDADIAPLAFAVGAPISQAAMDNLALSQLGFMTKLATELQDRVLPTLEEGIREGETISELRKRIQTATDFASSRAETIARTETVRVFNQASLARYEQHGIRMVEWITAGDERVDPDICEPLEGERFLIGNEPDNPAHPRCRCAWLPVILGGPRG